MKITFVLPFAGLVGGIRALAIYAKRLKKRGHDVFVVSLPPAPRSPIQQVKSLLNTSQAMSEAAYATATQYTWNDAVEHFEVALHSALERRQLATSQG